MDGHGSGKTAIGAVFFDGTGSSEREKRGRGCCRKGFEVFHDFLELMD